MLNPLLLGILGAVVALAMLTTELMGHSWFTLQLTSSCGVPLWSLFAVYSALQFIVWRGSRGRTELTDAEVTRWGPKLEQVTPTILAMYGQRTHVRDIARELEQSHGLPQDVTLRYIVALARHVREHKQDMTHAPERDHDDKGTP